MRALHASLAVLVLAAGGNVAAAPVGHVAAAPVDHVAAAPVDHVAAAPVDHVVAVAVGPVAAAPVGGGVRADLGAVGRLAFDTDRYVDQRGDVVAVGATVPAGETLRLRLERGARNATATVTDDGDGRVRLGFNSYVGEWTAAGSDAVSATGGRLEAPPSTGTYELTLASDDETATATMVLQPATIERVGTWQAPENATTLARPADVRAAIEDGVLRRATGVNRSHVLVLQVDASGLSGAVAAADGPNATSRFRTVLAEHGDLVVSQHEATVAAEELPARLHVLDGPGVRVLPDGANDTYYVVVDLDAARLTEGVDGATTTLEDEVPYEEDGVWLLVRATVAATSPLTDAREVARAVVAPRDATATTDPDDRLHFAPAPNQTVSGFTNVAPGWNVTVVLAGADVPDTSADESFRRTREVTVEAATDHHLGAFETAFDLRGVPPADPVTLDVRHRGRSLLDGAVDVVLAAPRASISVESVAVGGAFPAVGVTASLDGGFVALHADAPDGPVVGHSRFLATGEHEVTVYVGRPTTADRLVAVAHRDANHNEWFDGPSVDPAYAEQDPADDVVLASTPTARSPGATTAPPATAPPPGGSAIPGFGAIAAALAAVAAAAIRRSS